MSQKLPIFLKSLNFRKPLTSIERNYNLFEIQNMFLSDATFVLTDNEMDMLILSNTEMEIFDNDTDSSLGYFNYTYNFNTISINYSDGCSYVCDLNDFYIKEK
jgi:hypothetical protein